MYCVRLDVLRMCLRACTVFVGVCLRVGLRCVGLSVCVRVGLRVCVRACVWAWVCVCVYRERETDRERTETLQPQLFNTILTTWESTVCSKGISVQGLRMACKTLLCRSDNFR